MTGIGICCFVFSANECWNKEPDSDAEDEEYGEEEAPEEEVPEVANEIDEEVDLAEDFVAKIVLVGEKGVGKTLLWSRYTRGLIPKINIPTKSQSEDMFESKDVLIKKDAKETKLLLWDTSGREN